MRVHLLCKENRAHVCSGNFEKAIQDLRCAIDEGGDAREKLEQRLTVVEKAQSRNNAILLGYGRKFQDLIDGIHQTKIDRQKVNAIYTLVPEFQNNIARLYERLSEIESAKEESYHLAEVPAPLFGLSGILLPMNEANPLISSSCSDAILLAEGLQGGEGQGSRKGSPDTPSMDHGGSRRDVANPFNPKCEEDGSSSMTLSDSGPIKLSAGPVDPKDELEHGQLSGTTLRSDGQEQERRNVEVTVLVDLQQEEDQEDHDPVESHGGSSVVDPVFSQGEQDFPSSARTSHNADMESTGGPQICCRNEDSEHTNQGEESFSPPSQLSDNGPMSPSALQLARVAILSLECASGCNPGAGGNGHSAKSEQVRSPIQLDGRDWPHKNEKDGFVDELISWLQQRLHVQWNRGNPGFTFIAVRRSQIAAHSVAKIKEIMFSGLALWKYKKRFCLAFSLLLTICLIILCMLREEKMPVWSTGEGYKIGMDIYLDGDEDLL